VPPKRATTNGRAMKRRKVVESTDEEDTYVQNGADEEMTDGVYSCSHFIRSC